MAQKKAFAPRLYFAFIVFLPQSISLLFTKSLESWVTNWWNTNQSENFLTDIQEKSMMEKFFELEDLLLFDEIIKEDLQTHRQNLCIGIHTAIIELIKIHNEEHIHTILHLSTNLISFVILIAYSILAKKELVIINSWAQEFFYNLTDATKALCIIFLADLFLGFHSNEAWELVISSVCRYLGFDLSDETLSCLFWMIPVFLDCSFKYWVFYHLTRASPSLFSIFDEMDR